MKKLLLFVLLLFSLISCTGSGGGGESSGGDSSGNSGAGGSDSGGNDSGGNDPGVNNPASTNYNTNLNSRIMNLWVQEVNASDEVVNEYPLLFNYQEFNLSENSIKIKAQCDTCTQFSNSFIATGGNEFYPIIDDMFNPPQALAAGQLISGFSMTSGESYYVTINGYDATGKIVAISYLKITNHADSNSKVESPQGVTCNNNMVNTHSEFTRTLKYMVGECLNGEKYNVSGYLEEDESIFHMVYFENDPNNSGKERIMHTMVDLKNFDLSGVDISNIYSSLGVTQKPSLKKNHLVVADNLDLGAGDLNSYPVPQIYRDESKLIIASATGGARELKFYSLDGFTASWTDGGVGGINSVKKLKFSKRFDNASATVVLYYLKDDGSFYEYEFMGGMPMMSQVYTFTTNISVYDFDVNYNSTSQTTKFIFIEDQDINNKPIYLAKYNQSFNLNNFNLSSCDEDGVPVILENIANNDSNPASSNKFYNPIIKVSNDGRSWFKFSKLEESNGSPNNATTLICKEDQFVGNDTFGANGFNDSFSLVLDQINDFSTDSISDSIASGGDLVVSSLVDTLTNDYELVYLGAVQENTIFGSLTKVKRIGKGYNFPIFSSIDGLNNTFGITSDKYFTGINLFTSENANLVGAINLYNYLLDTNTNSYYVANSQVCFSYSNYNQSDFNAFQDKTFGIDDLINNSNDHDGDGLDDYFEYYLGLNPSSSDSDGDGTSDLAEATAACQ